MSNSKTCSSIVQCLGNLQEDKLFLDFTVVVGETSFRCHRLVLAACSEFFQALFSSGLREATENSVVLQDVSSEVFQKILSALYSGQIDLTSENYTNIWRAANKLQVMFLVDLCEKFAIEAITMETWEKIYETASELSSKRCLDQFHLFMLKNFEKIRLSPTFLLMSFKEVKDLIKSQDLVVSVEDLVLDSVIKWVEYEPPTKRQINMFENGDLKNEKAIFSVDENEIKDTVKDFCLKESVENSENAKRKKYQERSGSSRDIVNTETSPRKDKLAELLKEVRTYLVSPDVLSRVLKMDLMTENKESREIIVDAMSYHVQKFKHGQWSSASVHRSCSEYIHTGVYTKLDGSFSVISADKEELFYMKQCEYLQENIQLVTFDGELYATGTEEQNPDCRMFVFFDNSWKRVADMPSHNLLLVSHGDFIYILNKDDKVIYKITPKSIDPNLEKMTEFPENVDCKHASIIEHFLLIFCSESNKGTNKTSVYKFDILSKIWTRLRGLGGPAEQLITFRNDKHNYILQTNGSLWLILYSSDNGNIGFKFLAKLWNFAKRLYGGLTFQSKLIIFENQSESESTEEKTLCEVPPHFTDIKYCGVDCYSSNVVPVTILKKLLLH
ncbi:kelch-like protein 41b [Physella acuta]|uniref:kelch-like protein 41b n=1 Tax=Physella acuta TaxID=109671 RepID=UPI0027DE8F41|nr:kelch-like protein 41b [Physella acuta]